MKLTETIVKFGKLIEYLIDLVLEPFIILTALKKVSYDPSLIMTSKFTLFMIQYLYGQNDNYTTLVRLQTKNKEF